jgi:hypothetical protein
MSLTFPDQDWGCDRFYGQKYTSRSQCDVVRWRDSSGTESAVNDDSPSIANIRITTNDDVNYAFSSAVALITDNRINKNHNGILFNILLH